MANPWDQQEGEPDAEYNRFLTYLGMGSTRSLRKAFCAYHGRPYPKKAKDAPRGTWYRDSKEWRWVDRVRAYDRVMIQEVGRATCTKVFHGFDLIALRGVEELERTKPKGWKQAVEALILVSKYIPAETAASVALPLPPGEPAPNVLPAE